MWCYNSSMMCSLLTSTVSKKSSNLNKWGIIMSKQPHWPDVLFQPIAVCAACGWSWIEHVCLETCIRGGRKETAKEINQRQPGMWSHCNSMGLSATAVLCMVQETTKVAKAYCDKMCTAQLHRCPSLKTWKKILGQVRRGRLKRRRGHVVGRLLRAQEREKISESWLAKIILTWWSFLVSFLHPCFYTEFLQHFSA